MPNTPRRGRPPGGNAAHSATPTPAAGAIQRVADDDPPPVATVGVGISGGSIGRIPGDTRATPASSGIRILPVRDSGLTSAPRLSAPPGSCDRGCSFAPCGHPVMHCPQPMQASKSIP